MKYDVYEWREAENLSLPSRECGLKSNRRDGKTRMLGVTPFAGVWIEIKNYFSAGSPIAVTPFAGVWIEISIQFVFEFWQSVTPFAGVWIEMFSY